MSIASLVPLPFKLIPPNLLPLFHVSPGSTTMSLPFSSKILAPPISALHSALFLPTYGGNYTRYGLLRSAGKGLTRPTGVQGTRSEMSYRADHPNTCIPTPFLLSLLRLPLLLIWTHTSS